MRLLRLLLVVAGVAGVALAVRALLSQDRPAREPASLDTWPPVPRKPTGEASAA